MSLEEYIIERGGGVRNLFALRDRARAQRLFGARLLNSSGFRGDGSWLGIGFGVWGLGFGVQGLGCGAQGLGFGIWGFGVALEGVLGLLFVGFGCT